jgi:hypothetical protein
MGQKELEALHDREHEKYQHVNVPLSKRDANTRNKERQVASKQGVEHANHMPSQLGQGGTVNNRAEKGSQGGGAGGGISKRATPNPHLDKRTGKSLRDIAARENGVYDRV